MYLWRRRCLFSWYRVPRMSDYQYLIQALNFLALWGSLSWFIMLSRPMSTIILFQLYTHLVPIMGFFTSLSRHRVWFASLMSHSTNGNSDHVKHSCSPYNYFQKFQYQEFLMLLGNQPVPVPLWMSLHTYFSTNMIFRLLYQNLSVFMMKLDVKQQHYLP